MYDKNTDHNKYIMSDWRKELDSRHALKQKIVLEAENHHIKIQLLDSYSTLYRLTKYKNYDAFFIKHNYADAFKSLSTKSTQIPIESGDIDNFLNPYKSYFTDCVFSKHDGDE